MLFRPSFCANCGEKIERAEWKLWTSRRFCDLCASELMGHDILPKIAVGIGVLATIVGFGAYLKGGSEKAELPLVKKRSTDNSNNGVKVAPAGPNTVSAASSTGVEIASATPLSSARTLAALPQAKPDTVERPSAEESQYYCGAQTKKGTPCSRRVKGNVRCFQHQGMPAMLSGEKLKVG